MGVEGERVGGGGGWGVEGGFRVQQVGGGGGLDLGFEDTDSGSGHCLSGQIKSRS